MGKYITNVDTVKKVFTIDESVKPTARDTFECDSYIRNGYKVRWKSEARTIKAKERADKKASTEEIQKVLENFEDLKAKFEEIKKGKGKGHGVFAAKSWYEKTAVPEIEKRKNEKKTK